MNIGTRQWLATGSALATIGLIAAALAWTEVEVKGAERQRRQATEIVQGLTELRLVTFEYALNRQERPRVQWYAVSERINRFISLNQFMEPAPKEILAALRERRATAQRLFGEFVAASAAHGADSPGNAINRRYEAQLLNRLLIDQQSSTADAFRLNELASERIEAAERQESIIVHAGLALLALITAGGAWLMHRGVLAPIVQLQRATQRVAAGDLEARLGMARGDEIGELARNFDAMTQSLRKSFALVEQSNRALASAEERTRVMFESAPTAMVMVDKAGAIVQVNAQALALFGYARDELLGKSVDMLVPQRSRGAHPTLRGGFVARPQARPMGGGRDLHARRKDGREIPVEIGLNPIPTSEGMFVLSAIFDLTERKRALDEINNLNVALVLQAGQLEIANRELESFSYSVSHDLRAPLRAMDGFSLVLLEDYGAKLDAEGKDALERIRAGSQRMGALIDDLLRLANVTRAPLDASPVDLSALARECADALQRAQPGRAVQWQIEPRLRVAADAPLMRIAMQNLLENAWKFSGKKERATIRVGAVARDGGTAFFVADDGAGFDPAYASRMFDAFQRLHHTGEFEGTGIGLAIVKRIVSRHGGRIWAESKPGAGATFYFTVGDMDAGDKEGDARGQRHSAG